jgi:RNA polymerase sigma factor for flagellar operon FliA
MAQSETTPRAEKPLGNEIHQRYLPLVRRIAMRTVRSLPSTLTLDDILSAGWVGLIEAHKRRTPDQTEEQFEAYASYRVRGAILDYLRSLDPLSRKLRGASRRISEAIRDLTNKLGRTPNEGETAAELGLTIEAYQELLGDVSEAGFARLSLSVEDEPVADAPSPEAETARRELVDHVSSAIEGLPERLQLVLALHYQEGCSFREIGEVLSVTESRVSQLHSLATHMIRARLEGKARREKR